MQLLAQGGDLLGGRVRPQRDARRIAGDDPGDGEDQHGDPDQDDQRGAQALGQDADDGDIRMGFSRGERPAAGRQSGFGLL